MKNVRYLPYAALLTTLLSACSPVNSVAPFDQTQAAILIKENLIAKPTKQMIRITPPKNELWKRADESQKTKTPVMLIPVNQSKDHFSESIRTKIAGYIYSPDLTAQQFVDQEISHAKENCNDVHSNILASTNEYVIYQLDKRECLDQYNQIQLGKTFNGVDAVYTVYYTRLLGPASKQEWKAISNSIQNAQLVRNPRYKFRK